MRTDRSQCNHSVSCLWSHFFPSGGAMEGDICYQKNKEDKALWGILATNKKISEFLTATEALVL